MLLKVILSGRVDLHAFFNVFPLPSVLWSRLFQFYDRAESGHLDKEAEFNQSHGVVCFLFAKSSNMGREAEQFFHAPSERQPFKFGLPGSYLLKFEILPEPKYYDPGWILGMIDWVLWCYQSCGHEKFEGMLKPLGKTRSVLLRVKSECPMGIRKKQALLLGRLPHTSKT